MVGSGGLTVIDITDPTAPFEVGSLAQPPEAFDIADNFTQSEELLVTIDFTDPATPIVRRLFKRIDATEELSRIVAAIEADARDVYLGFPEKLFARLNGLLPRLIDGGLRRQNRLSARFAREA